jgi:hypothetical protein
MITLARWPGGAVEMPEASATLTTLIVAIVAVAGSTALVKLSVTGRFRPPIWPPFGPAMNAERIPGGTEARAGRVVPAAASSAAAGQERARRSGRSFERRAGG